MKKLRSRPEVVQKKSRALLTMTALLITSAVIRVSDGAGTALAQAAEIASSFQDLDASNTNVPEFADLLAALAAREERVTEREQQLKERQRLLEEADLAVEEKLVKLSLAENNLRATISLAASAAEDDIMQLVNVYQAMKPKDAALLFEEMAPDFAVGFLGRMTPEAAARILSGLSPETAYAFSAVLAGRNAHVPKN
jgi:flagellar motility protein MotE (MotC chaperone)